MREAHAFCVSLALLQAGVASKPLLNGLGTVLDEYTHLTMKVRGMMRESNPQRRRTRPLHFFAGQPFFLFPFDRCMGFL